VTDQPDSRPQEFSLPRGRLRRGLPLVGLTTLAVGAGPQGRAAERYAELLGRSRGALMKAGQILSFVALGAALPDDQRAVFQAALARLQDDAPPMPSDVAAAVVEAELRQPLCDAFAEFDVRPIAAASIGQVHAARLPDGHPVAVKVQYPGVAEAIGSDLRNGQLLASFLQLGRGLTSVSADVTALAAELAALISAELDYRAEAISLAQFAAAYGGHPLIRIPEIVPELCTSRVLTMGLADGRRWAEAVRAPAALRDQWGEVIARFALGSLRRLRMINADAHPGNYLFHDDGGVTFLDFGCVKRYTATQVATLEAALRAAVGGDATELSRVLAEGGPARTGTAAGLAARGADPGGRSAAVHIHAAVRRGTRADRFLAFRTARRRHRETDGPGGFPLCRPRQPGGHCAPGGAARYRRLGGHPA
jgi:predicted unusual protein kinase regulating ubiquinone biosynthesis (AarF/ABC1/UbiB family)